MSWHKVVFPEGEEVFGRPFQMGQLVEQRDKSVGSPKGFALFSEVNEDVRHVFYFSPVASLHCADIIEAYGGVPCDAPDASWPSFRVAYGGSESMDLLK